MAWWRRDLAMVEKMVLVSLSREGWLVVVVVVVVAVAVSD